VTVTILWAHVWFLGTFYLLLERKDCRIALQTNGTRCRHLDGDLDNPKSYTYSCQLTKISLAWLRNSPQRSGSLPSTYVSLDVRSQGAKLPDMHQDNQVNILLTFSTTENIPPRPFFPEQCRVLSEHPHSRYLISHIQPKTVLFMARCNGRTKACYISILYLLVSSTKLSYSHELIGLTYKP
jgi:hypothetical protein